MSTENKPAKPYNTLREAVDYIIDMLGSIRDTTEALKEIAHLTATDKQEVQSASILDNQDLCFKLNVSKKTLQRYRSTKGLPYRKVN
ncbi:MAG: helix-turn-helix domain-containing protein [Odoribacter sp.]|nr:helix-turn-helix domain-containing protein [Odoribacter sp.]